MLGELGVAEEHETIYRAVLRSPRATLAELAGDGHGDDVERILESLGQLGIVSAQDGYWIAVPPDHAVEMLIAREEERLRTRQARLEEARSTIPTLVAEFVDGRRFFVGDQLELLTDPQVVRSRLYQFAQAATTAVWSTSPGAALSADAVTAALPLDRELARRGLDARMIVGGASVGPAHWQDYLSALDELGHRVRVSDSVGVRMIVVDGELAVIPSSDEGRPGAYVLHGRALVAPLMALFEELWNHAEPFAAATGSRSVQITEAKMRQVAVLLAKGLKDETIARRLGVSIRTMRRLIAATMTELDADGRFRAGVHAAWRGWIEPARESRPD